VVTKLPEGFKAWKMTLVECPNIKALPEAFSVEYQMWTDDEPSWGGPIPEGATVGTVAAGRTGRNGFDQAAWNAYFRHDAKGLDRLVRSFVMPNGNMYSSDRPWHDKLHASVARFGLEPLLEKAVEILV
jgi:hypothetical protein